MVTWTKPQTGIDGLVGFLGMLLLLLLLLFFFDDEFFFNGENDESKGDATKNAWISYW